MADTTLRATLRLAEDDIGAGRPKEALARCHHILAHYPEMLEARRVLGEAYLALQKPKEAYQAFDRVLVSDPENTLAYCGRALINQQAGDLDSALDCYYQACELSLGNRQLRLEFRRVASQANQPDFVLSRVGLARLYMRGDLLAHAIREWELVLQGDPERVDARLGLAEALWRDGQTARAAAQCRLILQAIPSCLKALLLLGEIAYRSGKSSEAHQYLEQARRHDPDGLMARELFADTLVYDEAFAAFILAEPARIPVMDERDLRADLVQPSALATLLKSTEAPQPDAGVSNGAAEGNGQYLASDPFSFSFLGTGVSSDSPALREGESLEDMLAALIERPILPEGAPPPDLASAQPSPPQATDRLQELLMSFSFPEGGTTPSPAVLNPSDDAPVQPSPALSWPTSGSAQAASHFAEAFSWLETTNQQSPEPETDAASVEATLVASAQHQREEASFALLRPRREEEWPEEDTEAGWLRWLQAQGAQQLDAAGELLEDAGPFAALLHPAQQEEKQRTPLWESPDPEFVQSFWPTDTVPHPAVRLTPGSTSKSGSIAQRQMLRSVEHPSTQDEEAANLARTSSVSLRPLTLEELEINFSASGLRHLEGTLAALAGETDDKSETPGDGEAAILTIAEDDYPTRLELAEHQRKLGQIEAALGHYRAVLRGAPALVDAVIEGLLAVTREVPEQAAAFRLLGDAYTQRGDYMEALEAYNRGRIASRGY